MLVTLLRHGQISANVERRYVGCKTDEKLTDEGIRQAEIVDAPKAEKLYVSPLTRCKQTAQIAYPDMPMTVVDDLREMDFGIFEGRSADEMIDFKPYRSWVDSMCVDPIPDGESMEDFDSRCAKAFEEVVNKSMAQGHQSIAFVIHGGTIMSIMGNFNDEGKAYFEYHLNNCEFYLCDCELEKSTNKIKLHRIGGKNPEGSLPPSPPNSSEQ